MALHFPESQINDFQNIFQQSGFVGKFLRKDLPTFGISLILLKFTDFGIASVKGDLCDSGIGVHPAGGIYQSGFPGLNFYGTFGCIVGKDDAPMLIHQFINTGGRTNSGRSECNNSNQNAHVVSLFHDNFPDF